MEYAQLISEYLKPQTKTDDLENRGRRCNLRIIITPGEGKSHEIHRRTPVRFAWRSKWSGRAPSPGYGSTTAIHPSSSLLPGEGVDPMSGQAEGAVGVPRKADRHLPRLQRWANQTQSGIQRGERTHLKSRGGPIWSSLPSLGKTQIFETPQRVKSEDFIETKVQSASVKNRMKKDYCVTSWLKPPKDVCLNPTGTEVSQQCGEFTRFILFTFTVIKLSSQGNVGYTRLFCEWNNSSSNRT